MPILSRPIRGGGSHVRKGILLLAGIVAAVHAVISLAVIFLVLLHSGRGGGLSDAFGGGFSSGGFSGSTVVERNLDRITVITAVLFGITTLWLTWLWR